jgi:hypothetical protein
MNPFQTYREVCMGLLTIYFPNLDLGQEIENAIFDKWTRMTDKEKQVYRVLAWNPTLTLLDATNFVRETSRS